ncbi:MAG TPA: phosphoglycerate kinase [Elusimicrobiota bacterium]|nr:phosphoglycerate kinase [Elusimicrobiota bacterium]
MNRIKSINDLAVTGKRVLVRVDYNVPMDKNAVTDDTRVRASLPTLNHLIKNGARVILISHLGRPKGAPNPKYSLAPVAQHLSQLIKKPVAFVADCVGAQAEEAARTLKNGDVLLLENLRFHPEEEKNDPAFAKKLAGLGELFVQDAFGAVHRAHASTAGVPALLPSAAGLLLLKELDYLGRIKENPAKPFVAIVGGAKVSDKIEVLDKLIEKVDSLVIGGAMAYTFLRAQGVATGKSLVEPDKVDLAKDLMKKAAARGAQVLLPLDHVAVKAIDNPASAHDTAGTAIADDELGVDVGPKSLQSVAGPLAAAKTIFWNGPMGIFEVDRYAAGTRRVAALSADAATKGCVVVVGGGDSVAAVQSTGLADKISHISTGGGASLEFLEGKELPGVTALAR